MASLLLNVLVLAISMFLCSQRGLCVRFVITPAKGTESLTPNVTLTCQTTTTPTSGSPREMLLMQISRGDDMPVALLRGNGEISYGGGVTRRLEGVGEFAVGVFKGGYLNVTLHFPRHQDTGIYKCHVVYLDDVGVASYESSDAYLDIDRSSLSNTETRLQSLEALVHSLNRQVQQLNATTSMKKDSSTHYFSASIGKNEYHMQDKMTVIFDKIITQEGQGYNEETGIFTAPVDGLYAFFLVLSLQGTDMSAGFSLQTHEARELVKLYLEGKSLGDQSSTSTVAKLKAGDQVKVVGVYLTDATGYFYQYNYSVFSGFLIKSM